MGTVVSYDEKFGLPNSEIRLASGEHVFIALGKDGLAIKLLARPGSSERTLVQADPATVAKICDGLFEIRLDKKASPLQMLVAAVTQLPDARAVETAFGTAASA